MFGWAVLDIPTQITPGVCDWTIPIPVNIFHSYPTDHEFIVEILIHTYILSLSDPGNLTNITKVVDPANNTTLITGNFTAPFDPTGAGTTLQLIFSRLNIFSNYHNARISIFDPSCGQDPVAFLDDITIFVDPIVINLEPYSSSLFEHVATGLINFCPGPGCAYTDNLLVDDLDIDVNHVFFNNGPNDGSIGTITFLPGGKITVKTMRTLTIDNYSIFSCFDQLAQGIIVEPGATLILNNCNISDCRFGIDVQPGATISVTNCNFSNNFIGARFNMTGAPFRATINSFANNNFFSDAPLKDPFPGMTEVIEERGYCGLKAHNYRDFNIWGGNNFSALANGIIITNTTGNLGNMTFNDMNSIGIKRYKTEGIGIYANSKAGPNYLNINEFWTSMTFNNCKTGIEGHYCGANVENVSMTNVDKGIDWERSPTRDLVFTGNSIFAKKYGVKSFLNEPLAIESSMYLNTIAISGFGSGITPATGILANELGLGSGSTPGFGWKIDENNVTMDHGGRGIHYRNGVNGRILRNSVTNLSQANDYNGIWAEAIMFSSVVVNTVNQGGSAGLGNSNAIRSSAGFSNSVLLNCVDNTNVGIQFYDMADFTNRVLGNSMNTHVTGLQLGDQGIGNVFIGNQEHTGNVWDLAAIPIGGFGGINWGTNFGIIGASRFFVDELENPALNPDVDPGSGWFIDQSTPGLSPAAITCMFPPNPIPNPAGEDGNPTDLDIAIAGGNLPTDVFESETRWKGAYRLYRKMLRHPGLESQTPLMANFKAANDNISTGKLAYIAEERGKLFQLSSTEQTTLSNLKNTWYQKIEALSSLDSIRQAGTLVTANQYNTALQERSDAQIGMEQFYTSYTTSTLQRIQNLLALNASVNASTTPALTHKTVNTILLNMLAADTISSADLAVLSGIANQCPLESGDAVYEARAIVSHFLDEEFEDRDLCLDAAYRDQAGLTPKKEDASVITFYPNPAHDAVFWTGTGSEVVFVRLFNQLGQLQQSWKTDNGFVPASGLPAGIYTVQLSSIEGALLKTQRIILK